MSHLDTPGASTSQSGTRPVATSRKTPPPSNSYYPKETFVHRHTDTHEYKTGDLRQKRKAMIIALGNQVPVVNVEWFLKSVLPALPGSLGVDTIMGRLKKSKVIKKTRWRAFRKNPSQSKDERKTFENLSTIFESIVEAATQVDSSLDGNQKYRLVINPDLAPESERDSKTRADAYFVCKEVLASNQDAAAVLEGKNGGSSLSSSSKDVKTTSGSKDIGGIMNSSWYDLAFPMEFKLRDNVDTRNDVRGSLTALLHKSHSN